MAARGTYRNPSERNCFEVCTACFRCQARHEANAKCRSCSGHHDERGDIDPHPMDVCYCTRGILRWVSKQGHVITKKYPDNPFQGDIKVHTESEDERDWKRYLTEQREKLDDPNWDPIDIYDSSKDPRGMR